MDNKIVLVEYYKLESNSEKGKRREKKREKREIKKRI